MFKEFFSDENKKINDFEFVIWDYTGEYLYYVLEILMNFDIKTKLLFDKLIKYNNGESNFLSLNDINEFYHILKKVINNPNFKEQYLIKIKEKNNNIWISKSLEYSFRIKKFEGVIEVKTEDINQFPEFILGFLSVLIENNAGLECYISS